MRSISWRDLRFTSMSSSVRELLYRERRLGEVPGRELIRTLCTTSLRCLIQLQSGLLIVDNLYNTDLRMSQFNNLHRICINFVYYEVSLL